MGAGLASVLSNLQIVIVLIAAWIVWSERPSPTQAIGIPIALGGIVLISGVLGGDAYGADPLHGIRSGGPSSTLTVIRLHRLVPLHVPYRLPRSHLC